MPEASPAPEPAQQPSLLPELERAREAAVEASRRHAEQAKKASHIEPAPTSPVAQVLVDVPLAHLDRPFDYLVPLAMAETAVVGARVKVRFAGQEVGGFIVARTDHTDHVGRLAPLRRVVSPEPVLSPAIARLSAQLAARYAGTRSDVLRLAVPPRHATVEKAAAAESAVPTFTADVRDAGVRAWSPYDESLTTRLAAGERVRAVWTALGAEDPLRLLAYAAAATVASGRGVVICVPDQRDLARLDAAVTEVLGEGVHVSMTADLGPARRYRAFLAASRGAARVVIGTRAAAYAPVVDPGLFVIWDDGDDLHAEPRAPYPHVREVLLQRALDEDASILVAGHSRTVEGAYLVTSGWATDLAAPRDVVRRLTPEVRVTGATEREFERDPFTATARFPGTAQAVIREGLTRGPVLVQTPRQGYAGAVVCDECRAPARCAVCSGPLALLTRHQPPTCRWCGHAEPGRQCPECQGKGLRALIVGDLRTAEELGRAHPGTTVRRSGGEQILATVPDAQAIVVATPGAEPHVDGGYAAAVLLDTWLAQARADLRVSEEALRRWLNAAALVRPDGVVQAVGDPADPTLQALVRWDPAGFAEREMRERQEAHLPPASRLVQLTASPVDMEAFLAELRVPEGTEILGPTPVEGPPHAESESVRVVVRSPRAAGAALSRALVEVQGVRSARKLPHVRVQVDPMSLG